MPWQVKEFAKFCVLTAIGYTIDCDSPSVWLPRHHRRESVSDSSMGLGPVVEDDRLTRGLPSEQRRGDGTMRFSDILPKREEFVMLSHVVNSSVRFIVSRTTHIVDDTRLVIEGIGVQIDL